MNGQIVIATLQKKVSELTLVNVMLEAQIQDLQTQLNSITEQKTSDAITDGNEKNAGKKEEGTNKMELPDFSKNKQFQTQTERKKNILRYTQLNNKQFQTQTQRRKNI